MSAFNENMSSNVSEGAGVNEEDVDEDHLIGFCRLLYEQLQLSEKFHEIQRFFEDHPIASVFLIVSIGMCTIPVVIFILFVMSSVALSIMSIFLFEGTVIAIGTFILGGVLFFVGLFAIGFSVFLISCYYIVQMSGTIIINIRDKLPFIPFPGSIGACTQATEEKLE